LITLFLQKVAFELSHDWIWMCFRLSFGQAFRKSWFLAMTLPLQSLWMWLCLECSYPLCLDA
jgi:hypothetical protein